jgi:hypothetical protein
VERPVLVQAPKLHCYSDTVSFQDQFLNPSLLRQQQSPTTSHQFSAFGISNVGKKMAFSTKEITMVVSDNHTTSSVMTGAFEYYSYFRITIFSLLLVKNQMSTGMD